MNGRQRLFLIVFALLVALRAFFPVQFTKPMIARGTDARWNEYSRVEKQAIGPDWTATGYQMFGLIVVGGALFFASREQKNGR